MIAMTFTITGSASGEEIFLWEQNLVYGLPTRGHIYLKTEKDVLTDHIHTVEY